MGTIRIPRAASVVVDTTLLSNPAAMSRLGRKLVSIAKKASKAGIKRRTLRQIHRDLA